MSDSRKKEKNRRKRDNSEKGESTKKKFGKKKRRNAQQAKKRSGQKTRKVTDKRRKANSSVRPVKKRAKKKRKQRKAFLIELGITAFLFLITIAVLSKFTFTTIKVDGYSMSEQVNDKDRLFINRLKTPNRFSLLVFKNEKGEQVVRRVIGLPGERLYYEEDQLFVNESYQTERYLEKAVSIANQGNMRFTEDFTLKQLTGENSVPEDNYFVLGDNRQYSTDSRHFGFVDKKEIIGVVEFRFFPFHTLSGF